MCHNRARYRGNELIDGKLEAVASTKGTSITVDDLFYTIPSRHTMYLGKESEETKQIVSLLQLFSIHYAPQGISFLLKEIPSRVLFKSPRCTSLEESIAGVLGSAIRPTLRRIRVDRESGVECRGNRALSQVADPHFPRGELRSVRQRARHPEFAASPGDSARAGTVLLLQRLEQSVPQSESILLCVHGDRHTYGGRQCASEQAGSLLLGRGLCRETDRGNRGNGDRSGVESAGGGEGDADEERVPRGWFVCGERVEEGARGLFAANDSIRDAGELDLSG